MWYYKTIGVFCSNLLNFVGEDVPYLRLSGMCDVQFRSIFLLLTLAALLMTCGFACGDSGRTTADQVQVDSDGSEQTVVGQTQDDLDRRRTKADMVFQAQADLNLHRNLWYRSGIRDYTYVYRIVCIGCNKVFTSYVTNNVVVALEYASEHVDSNVLIYSNFSKGVYVHPNISYIVSDLDYHLSISTIARLFDILQMEILFGLDGLGMNYDSELGYPEMFIRNTTDPKVIDGFYGIWILSLSPS